MATAADLAVATPANSIVEAKAESMVSTNTTADNMVVEPAEHVVPLCSPRSISDIEQIAEQAMNFGTNKDATATSSNCTPATSMYSKQPTVDAATAMEVNTGENMKKPSKSEVAMTKKNIKSAEVTGSSKERNEMEKPDSKRRHQRPTPPPVQLLCEALSVVCDTQVTVMPGQGPWGGEGWI